MGHTPQESVGGVLLSLFRQWSCRWIKQLCLWCMASATPGLWLPFQPQGITSPWPVPNYTAWWRRHMRVNNLPKVDTWQWNGRDSNPQLFVSRANTLTITSRVFEFHYFCNTLNVPSMLWRCWLGSRKGIRPVKNWVVGCWHGYLSRARCRLAYGQADATATHCLLLL